MSPRRSLAAIAFVCLLLSSARANALTAYRIVDLYLRDPHTFVDFIGCRDVTDASLLGFSLNGQIQNEIQNDVDLDGFLDMSTLVVFDDYNPAAPGGTLTLVDSVPFILSYQNGSSGTCLESLPGTTYGPYTPEITSSIAPCFASEEFPGTILLFGGSVPLSLQHMQVAATYGAPDLVNGLIRGFLTETTANNTLLPNSLPLIGGLPFSRLLPGGDPPGTGNTNCASHSDIDLVEGVRGWWLYFNFTAQAVPYTSATGVDSPVARGVSIEAAVPNPFNPSTTVRYSIDEDAFVQLSVFDAQGRFVAELVSAHRNAGAHEARWNGTNAAGATASSGVYFVRLESDGKTDTRKIVLLK
jgi:hypothetical protein